MAAERGVLHFVIQNSLCKTGNHGNTWKYDDHMNHTGTFSITRYPDLGFAATWRTIYSGSMDANGCGWPEWAPTN